MKALPPVFALFSDQVRAGARGSCTSDRLAESRYTLPDTPVKPVQLCGLSNPEAHSENAVSTFQDVSSCSQFAVVGYATYRTARLTGRIGPTRLRQDHDHDHVPSQPSTSRNPTSPTSYALLFWYTKPKVHGDAKSICRKRGPACLRDAFLSMRVHRRFCLVNPFRKRWMLPTLRYPGQHSGAEIQSRK